MKNKYTESYIKRKEAIGWKRRFMFGPPEIIEDLVKEFRRRMLQYKLDLLNKQ